VLGDIALAYQQQGKVEKAKDYFENSILIHREIGNLRGEGTILVNLGALLAQQGRPEAEELYERAIVLLRETGNRLHEGSVHGNLGLLLKMNGKLQEAEKKYHEAIAIHRELGNTRSLGIMLGNMGDLMFLRDKFDEAEKSLKQGIEICDEIFPMAGGAFRGSLGMVLAKKGRTEEARRLLKEGEEILRGSNAIELGKLLCKRAQIEHLSKQHHEASLFFREAKKIARKMKVNSKSELGQSLKELKALL
jgi:tetratricopeptide (TPR) repeat protein